MLNKPGLEEEMENGKELLMLLELILEVLLLVRLMKYGES
jgi:hypothetical protein